jgi:two-component system response regulator HydG
LFYRLNVVHLEVPPLRERSADVSALASQYLKIYATKHGRALNSIAPEALKMLEAYTWPGNVRELANTIERAVIVANKERLEVSDLPEAIRTVVLMQERNNRRRTLAEVETEYINETLAATRGNKSKAAHILGISRKNLYERLARNSNGSTRDE